MYLKIVFVIIITNPIYAALFDTYRPVLLYKPRDVLS